MAYAQTSALPDPSGGKLTVNGTVSAIVYQNEENGIIVSADSNSEFFDRMQYVIPCDEKISEADIQVEWTTLMGNPKPAKDDQLAVAQVTISENGEIISQRKINFARKAIEVIADAGN